MSQGGEFRASVIESDSMSSVELIKYFESEINNARKYPRSVIPFLESRRFIHDYEFTHSLIGNIRYKTEEGVQAVEQVVQYLNSQQPTSQLLLSPTLCETAYLEGKSLSQLEIIEDESVFMPSMITTISSLGVQQLGQLYCIIEYGFRKDPEIIPSIIVSDGDPTREQRDRLMSASMRHMGIGVHEHFSFDYMLIILIADTIKQPMLKEDKGCNCAIF